MKKGAKTATRDHGGMVILWRSTKRKYLVFVVSVLLCDVFTICFFLSYARAIDTANVNFSALTYAFFRYSITQSVYLSIESCSIRELGEIKTDQFLGSKIKMLFLMRTNIDLKNEFPEFA